MDDELDEEDCGEGRPPMSLDGLTLQLSCVLSSVCR